MSTEEIAVAGAAPAEAPAAPEQPASQPEPVQEPSAPKEGSGEGEKPQSARDALQRIRERARGQRTAERTESIASKVNQPRDEAGRFKAEGEVAEEAPAPESGGPEADAAPGEGTPATGEKPVPEGFTRIPLPDGHPLRSRGVTHLDFPKDQEEYGRWAVNSAIRASEADRAIREAREAKLEATRERAEAQFWRKHSEEFFGEDFKQTYEDLKNTYGEDYAEEFKEGRLAKARQKMQEVVEAANEEFHKEEVHRTGERFISLALQDARRMFPHWSEGEVRSAIAQYGAWIKANNVPELKAEDWYRIAKPLYMQKPEVQREIRARAEKLREANVQKIREEARKEAAEAERQRLISASNSRKANPLGRVPNVQTDRGAPVDSGPTTAKEWKDSVRKRARGIS